MNKIKRILIVNRFLNEDELKQFSDFMDCDICYNEIRESYMSGCSIDVLDGKEYIDSEFPTVKDRLKEITGEDIIPYFTYDSSGELSMERIRYNVLTYFDLEKLPNNNKFRTLQVRYLIMYICYYYTNFINSKKMSNTKLGEFFGYKAGHSAIYNMLRSFLNLYHTDKSYRDKVNPIIKKMDVEIINL